MLNLATNFQVLSRLLVLKLTQQCYHKMSVDTSTALTLGDFFSAK